MENSKTEGYVAGSISILIGAFFIINSGWNPTTLLFGSFFWILGVLSLWRPDSAGQVTSRILKSISKNVKEQNTSRSKKTQKITQEIHVHGDMSNAIGDNNVLNTDSSNKGSKKPRKKR